VTDIPDADKQDPAFFRDKGSTPTRDGCRVPLPWTATGASFGFGTGPPHLPQPAWFTQYAVDAQEDDPESTLWFYRRALRLRDELQTDEEIEWMEHDDPIVSFRRAGGWVSMTNFGTAPARLPTGTVLIASAPLGEPTLLPPDTTVWLRVAGEA
jgi:alpha-glucosidase